LALFFLSEDIDFQLDNRKKYKNWLKRIIRIENKSLGVVTYHFVSKVKILDLNNKYLGHDYTTDVITFDNSFRQKIEGDIYICIETVRENSKEHSNQLFVSELNRVIVHGLLHLLGYDDLSIHDQKKMRVKEDSCLQMLSELIDS
jgi:rRNA maturation RNase YbeY